MFVRAKKSGAYHYLQIVHNERVNGKVRQQVLATLGRLDVRQETGQIEALIASCGRFAQHVAVLDAHRQGRCSVSATIRIGPSLVFERLWKELGLPEILADLLAGRRCEFPVERAVFLTVLHRLFSPGSDRATEFWRMGYAIAGSEALELHHLYRTMGWLGEPLPNDQPFGATPFVHRSMKDLIEEALFARRQNLFSGLDLVFFDTTSIYFQGEGGIYHKCDDTIRGHVFCSFLALVLLKELLDRLEARGWRIEWERLKSDLDALEEITMISAGKRFVVRSQTRGDAGKALQAAGVALGPTIRLAE